MFLRSLTIRGFKSFADKTTLEFTPGISVIVGPNGSGKSNISDAIAWVLGEQGAGALRGAQMSDVIFAGSPSRPPLGMAEVRLVLDNEAGLLPIPASEIEISRTLYRSGESEYRLGGRPCRLLDVQELLSDTGVGRALHTLIGQGHLEEVLTARPEDRRQLIEEAAGIAKHRRRRNRAERKLAGLEQDLLRLQDIVGELRRQLKPLKQQAEIAGRHEVLTQEAGALAAKLAAVRLRDLYRDRESRDPAWREAEARQAEVRRRLGELDTEIERAEAERSGAESAARQAEDAHAEAATRKSDSESALRLALRMEAEARERLSSAANRSARLFAVEDELARTEGALGEVDEGLRARSAELEEAERAFGRLEQQRRDAEEERRRLDASSALRRAEVESLRRSLAGHDAERARLSALRRELRQRHRAAVARIEELRRQVEALDATGAPLAAAQAGLEHERSELALSLIELEGEEKGLLARQEVVDARRAELSESPGAAFLRRRGDAAIGVLHDLIGAPPHLAVAVRAALGPLADAVVYGSQEDALRGAAQDLAAGVTLLSATPPAELRVSGSAPVPGVGPLLRSVRPDPRVAGLVARLLEGIYLVQNLAEAAARSRAHPSGQFVTVDGLVVGPS
ncbi:MAG: AAA family ATPase, partial [Actinobacteria bacterium]|nr:AAA family ATPase [Actinomycetota bacterium]